MCLSGSTMASEATKLDFRSAFEVLDADHDGKISKDDLRSFYKGFSRSVANNINNNDDDDDIIGSMIDAADFNKDGFVEYEEFERILGGGKKKRSVINGVMGDVFKVMDKDGDGKLSHEDLKSYMQWAGFDACDDDIKAMIKLASGAGDDKDSVSFDDLVKILAV